MKESFARYEMVVLGLAKKFIDPGVSRPTKVEKRRMQIVKVVAPTSVNVPVAFTTELVANLRFLEAGSNVWSPRISHVSKSVVNSLRHVQKNLV